MIGAASFLGGVVRMTISLTVILIESTNELSLGVPILLSVLVYICSYNNMHVNMPVAMNCHMHIT